MAVAYDTVSVAPGGAAVSWTHTPTGTPRGILVLCEDQGQNITGCTYGGVSMTAVSGSPNGKDTGEQINLAAFFLGSGIPTGAQTVAISGTLTEVFRGVAISLTADDDTEVVDTDVSINSDSLASPRATLSLGGRTSFAAMVFGSGVNNLTSTPVLTGWSGLDGYDSGAQVAAAAKYDTIGSTDVTIGWDQVADDAVAIGVAIAQVAAAGGSFQSAWARNSTILIQ